MDSGQILRLIVIALSFWAMWCLWTSYHKRRHIWTTRTRDIWLALLLWTFACAEGNIELFYRHTKPTGATFLVVAILLLTIRGVFNPEQKYTINQPD